MGISGKVLGQDITERSIGATPQKTYRFAYPMMADSVQIRLKQILNTESQSGYIEASLDSLVTDAVSTVFYINLGKRYHFKALLNHPEPDSLDLVVLPVLQGLNPEAGVSTLFLEWQKKGFWLSELSVQNLSISKDTVTVYYQSIRGAQLPFGGLVWNGKAKTDTDFAASWLDLKKGNPLQISLVDIQNRLKESGFFNSVGAPQLKVQDNERLVVEVPVSEEVPGTFDLVLGYLPPSGANKGSFTGNGQIQLRNIAGKGYRFGLKLNRNPGAISDFQSDVGASYFLGMPFRFKFQFKGYQRDTTFNQFGFLGEVGYRLAQRVEVNLAVQRELTHPVANNAQGLARSSVWFGGGGIKYSDLDQRINPTKGILLNMQVEQGRSQRANNSVLQQRFQFTGRGYWSPLNRQVLAIGTDAFGLFSPDFLLSDLKAFGGANSMRGYNESRFFGHLFARTFLEYRYLLDPESFAFLFIDQGFYRKPQIAENPKVEDFLTGFGIGIQYATALGMMQVIYGLNPEEGLDSGKIHFGLTFGL